MEVMLSTLQGTVDSRSPAADGISVSDFLKEAWDDYNSPTTSTFVLRLGQCRSTVSNLEEVGGVAGVMNCNLQVPCYVDVGRAFYTN